MFKAFDDEADEEEDWDSYFYNTVLPKYTGKHISRAAQYGLPSLAGVNFSGTFQDWLASKWNRGFTGDEGEIDIMGFPAVSSLYDMWQAAEYAGGGQGMKAFEKILPAGFAGFPVNSVVRGIREAKDGVTDSAGRKRKDIHDKYIKPSEWDTIVRLSGFNPVGVSEKTDQVWSEKKVKAKFADERRDLLTDYRSLINDSDTSPDDIIDLHRRIEEYNAKAIRSKRNIPIIDAKMLENALKDKDNKFFKEDLDEDSKKRYDKKAKSKIVIRNGRFVKEK
jgi:hypothetical protein